MGACIGEIAEIGAKAFAAAATGSIVGSAAGSRVGDATAGNFAAGVFVAAGDFAVTADASTSASTSASASASTSAFVATAGNKGIVRCTGRAEKENESAHRKEGKGIADAAGIVGAGIACSARFTTATGDGCGATRVACERERHRTVGGSHAD